MDGLEALASGRGFVELPAWRTIQVAGGDAVGWLNDLVSADLAGLAPGQARRSLLLSPTGRIRAAFTVAARERSFLLLQDPIQPVGVERLLAPYVLSSDVTVEDRTGQLCVFAFPGVDAPPIAPGAWASSPSCVGAGVDLIAPAGDRARVREALSQRFAPATGDDLETWRIVAGVPRFGVDATEDDLPQEAGLASAVSFGKGCFLGQEAVAKVRNLGHPRRVLLHAEVDAPVAAGDAIVVDGRDVGRITSAATADGRTLAFAQVRWDAREGPFAAPAGASLRTVDPR